VLSATQHAPEASRGDRSEQSGMEISGQATGYPGYNSIIPKDKATIGRILKENGYSTSWFSKVDQSRGV
jgi:arylsulfatase A-like enzyme